MKAPPETASTLRHRAVFRTCRHAVWSKRTWIGLIAHLWLSASVLAQQLTEVGPIGLTVAHLDRPLAFFTNALPFELEAVTRQSGDGWDQLCALDRVEARQATLKLGEERITALRAPRGPGIEFLEYIAPPGGRPLPPDAAANDLVFWHTRLVVDDLRSIAANAKVPDTKWVSREVASLPGARSVILRDSDGHALQLVEPAPDSRP